MAQVAQDTFVAELEDGSSLRVQRGSTWPDKHEVVRMDGGRGHLFKPLDIDGEADAPKSDAGAEAGDPPAEPEPEAQPDADAAEAEPAAAPVRASRRRPAKGSA